MYRKPPIVEAVIEFQLSEVVTAAALERTKALLSKRLPSVIDEENFNVHVDADQGTVNVSSESTGFRLLSRGETITLKRNLFAAAILAPYGGWGDLVSLAKEGWEAFSSAAAPRGSIARIGIRYVNRIDVPWPASGKLQIEDYLTFTYDAPQPPLNPSLEFLVSMMADIGNGEECRVRISSSSTESPLARHNGIVLDIDVFSLHPHSLSQGSVWDLVDRMRGYKNDVFEACITERSREMFGRA